MAETLKARIKEPWYNRSGPVLSVMFGVVGVTVAGSLGYALHRIDENTADFEKVYAEGLANGDIEPQYFEPGESGRLDLSEPPEILDGIWKPQVDELERDSSFTTFDIIDAPRVVTLAPRRGNETACVVGKMPVYRGDFDGPDTLSVVAYEGNPNNTTVDHNENGMVDICTPVIGNQWVKLVLEAV